MIEYRLLTIWRYSWQGQLPCRVVFEACTTRIEKRVAIEGVAPVARSMFIHSHALLMAQGGEGLARLPRSPLVGQETIDDGSNRPAKGSVRAVAGGQIDPANVL